MPRKKAEKGPPPLEDLPKSLRKTVVQIMAHFDLDIEAAYEKLAVLSRTNIKLYEDDVRKDGERRYKKRFMSQMNRARSTFQKQTNAKLLAHVEEGVKIGREEAIAEYKIHYYCSICNKPIDMLPNSNGHQAMIQYMRKNGWGHQACHSKSR
jgi:hypothetical protein